MLLLGKEVENEANNTSQQLLVATRLFTRCLTYCIHWDATAIERGQSISPEELQLQAGHKGQLRLH
jgi:hypothetical protein